MCSGDSRLHQNRSMIRSLEDGIKTLDRKNYSILKTDPASQRLNQVDGFGPLISTVLAAALGDGSAFRNRRLASAWLGLVPRQHSTGGKTVLLGISKRGDRYLRTLLIHSARSVIRGSEAKTDSLGLWASRLKREKGFNVATVALANKLARIAWALLFHQTNYRSA